MKAQPVAAVVERMEQITSSSSLAKERHAEFQVECLTDACQKIWSVFKFGTAEFTHTGPCYV